MRVGGALAFGAALLAAVGSAQAPTGELTLVLGGDVIFDAPIEYALRRTDRARDAAASYAPIFEDLRPVLQRAHHAIVNLESPVAVRSRSSGDGEPPRFAAPRAFLDALAEAGVDSVTLANNHAYDQGVAGLAETIAAVSAARLVGIGAGEEASAASARFVDVEGHRVALLAFTEGTNWRVLDEEADDPRVAVLDPERIASSVTEARAEAALVVVAFHWDEGRDHVPSPRMRRYAQLAIDAGADLIWGHGTHLPAGVSVLSSIDGRSVPVIWSLGNLVAVMNADDEAIHGAEPSVRESWLASVRLRAVGSRLAVAAIDPVPFWIGISEREGTPPFVRPLSLSREREAIEARGCGRRCERLAASLEARERRAVRTLRLEEVPASADVHVEREEPELVASLSVPAAPLVPAPAPAPAPALTPAPTPDRRPATDLGPIARGSLALTFEGDRTVESSVDAAQLSAIVAALRADGRLHLEVIAHPSSAEDRSLWSRRAARARGVVAIRGPSRARMHSRLGAIEATPRLEYQLAR